ncbi:hypothetical protein [Aquabacterium sp. J223]|uniref:hypothetical protein n=1 Tax=Aquabacterium sp. J223 TaxID=2898431 RepID=UPI0021ADE6E0|nr:hypothetical protein [Aquabacterium sp. J223]UUX97168.1 hypothetical protein LRS07_07980 [Aquabacterium sp. J223]
MGKSSEWLHDPGNGNRPSQVEGRQGMPDTTGSNVLALKRVEGLVTFDDRKFDRRARALELAPGVMVLS